MLSWLISNAEYTIGLTSNSQLLLLISVTKMSFYGIIFEVGHGEQIVVFVVMLVASGLTVVPVPGAPNADYRG